MKVLVCCHQQEKMPTDAICYQPIYCGKALSNQGLNIIGDDSGDNISSKNRHYCELTALYWAWKNLADFDIVGLVHYRRYFVNCISGCFFKEKITAKDLEEKGRWLLDTDDIRAMLEKHDIVMPRRKVLPSSLKEDYCRQHIPEDYDILKDTVKRLYPDYISSFEYVMEHNNKVSCYNMFIAKQAFLQSYCKWLFDILFDVEKNIKLSSYSYQTRVFGFMSERLLNVYCYHHKLRITYKPVLYISSQPSYSSLVYVLRNMRNTLLFHLSNMDIR